MGFANWWDQRIVPHVIRFGCAQKPIMELRREVVPLARGRVFELGCGGGINQQFYDPVQVTGYSGLDPSPRLLDYAREETALRDWHSDIRQGYGEDIPFEDASFDTVVSTFTLCSVNDHARTLAELRRILKPGGSFLYAEHGRAPDPGIARWQERIEPVWSKALGNCHLTRPITSAIEEAGFSADPLGRRYMKPGPKFAGWMEWGRAVKKD